MSTALRHLAEKLDHWRMEDRPAHSSVGQEYLLAELEFEQWRSKYCDWLAADR
jgi:hypothetical protein